MSKETLLLTDGRTVYKEDYIKAKTKDMIEFGYSDLTEETVRKQLENILSGKELDVIGMFMEDDIEIPQ